MKLVTTTKGDLEDVIYEIASETLEKFKGLNSCVKIDEVEDIDLSDLKDEGNAFVYISTLNENGDVDIDNLKKYKRVILIALGAKYQKLLKSIFDEENDGSIKACNLFDLDDCFIISNKAGIKLLDMSEE